MVDMWTSDILAEWDRLFPDKKDDYGVLNLDFGIFFPYSNQDAVTFKIGLLNDSILSDDDTEDDDKYIFTDTILNHRYPNKGYITLSKKIGRKVCKTGYPICAPFKQLNSYKMLVIKFGIRKETGTLGFPISVNLSKEKPIGGLDFHVLNWEDPSKAEESGLWFSTYESVLDGDGCRGGINQRYIIGKPLGQMRGMDIVLKAIPTEQKGLWGFQPTMVIKGQPIESFFL